MSIVDCHQYAARLHSSGYREINPLIYGPTPASFSLRPRRCPLDLRDLPENSHASCRPFGEPVFPLRLFQPESTRGSTNNGGSDGPPGAGNRESRGRRPRLSSKGEHSRLQGGSGERGSQSHVARGRPGGSFGRHSTHLFPWPEEVHEVPGTAITHPPRSSLARPCGISGWPRFVRDTGSSTNDVLAGAPEPEFPKISRGSLTSHVDLPWIPLGGLLT